jgi:hypothetical protein
MPEGYGITVRRSRTVSFEARRMYRRGIVTDTVRPCAGRSANVAATLLAVPVRLAGCYRKVRYPGVVDEAVAKIRRTVRAHLTSEKAGLAAGH